MILLVWCATSAVCSVKKSAKYRYVQQQPTTISCARPWIRKMKSSTFSNSEFGANVRFTRSRAPKKYPGTKIYGITAVSIYIHIQTCIKIYKLRSREVRPAFSRRESPSFLVTYFTVPTQHRCEFGDN